MKSLLVSDLKPGMKFSEPVYLDGTNLLVQKAVPLKEKEIDRIVRWGITEVMTEGEVMSDEPTPAAKAESVKEGLARMAFAGDSQKVMAELYQKFQRDLGSIHDRIRNNDPVEAGEVNQLVDDILKALMDRRNDFIQYILFGLQGESHYVENAINCTVLSILIANNMNLPRHKTNALATGALLHDIGMLRVPHDILQKTDTLTSAELQQVKTHPVHSYRIITKEIKLSEEIGLTALQHQERWDGQGYPKGLVGKDIMVYARIVAVADAFEAMVSERPYRDSMIGYTAMRTILSDNGRRFDPEILKVFIRSLGIYPIGSIVLLSDASIGRVIENLAEAPLRPRIRIMIDSLGQTHLSEEGSVIDLMEDRSLFIARAVNPKELSGRVGFGS
jgi:HD-GYP domain-containing protein (c-di-GMP phosphodiesterase class II)